MKSATFFLILGASTCFSGVYARALWNSIPTDAAKLERWSVCLMPLAFHLAMIATILFWRK